MPAETSHPSFPQPINEDVSLWRFMDFTKFVGLLSTSSLYFCRSDKFLDNFEGSVPLLDSEEHQMRLAKQHFPEDELPSIKNMISQITQSRIISREFIYINCWHSNSHESAAMWDLYKGDVAIKTTYAKLRKILPDGIYLGLVKYLDFQTQKMVQNSMLNLFDPFMIKRKSFEHEKEVRAVWWDGENYIRKHGASQTSYTTDATPQPNLSGNVKINICKLIDEVYVSPTAAPWIYDLVVSVMNKYELSVPVRASDLYGTPLY